MRTKILFVALWFVTSQAYSEPVEVTAEVRFSPKGGIQDSLIEQIDGAKKKILVLAYSFTNEKIAQALVRAQKRNVPVTVIIDYHSSKGNGNQCQTLKDNGIVVKTDKEHPIAHNKVILIDDKIVCTGSFNFSNTAEINNAENSLILKSKNLCRKYTEDFQKHEAHSKEF